MQGVYGDEATNSPLFDSDGTFRIKRAFGLFAAGFHRTRLKVDGKTIYRAEIPEPRDDENVVVAQLHHLVRRLHNGLLSSGLANSFDDGRRLTTLLIQLVIAEDFLRTILNDKVYRSCVLSGEQWLRLPPGAIPIEFSHAAFRFGHSMVRDRYKGFKPPHKFVETKELFQSGTRLRKRFVVDWTRYFSSLSNAGDDEDLAQKAMSIDAHCAIAMTRSQHHASIVMLNLDAGKSIKPIAGFDYLNERVPEHARRFFNLVPIPDLGHLRHELTLEEDYSVTDLPLWPYILLESNSQYPSDPGSRLGTLGSLICAEVIVQSMMGANVSVYSGGFYDFERVLNELGDVVSFFKRQPEKR